MVKTQFGIASGNTRRKAVPEWPEEYREVKDYYEHLKIAVADNIQEVKPKEWWIHFLNEAAKELKKQGVEKIASRLEQDFPVAKWKIYRYLLQEFKDPEKVKAGEASAQAKAVVKPTTELSIPQPKTAKILQVLDPQKLARVGYRKSKYGDGYESSRGIMVSRETLIAMHPTLFTEARGEELPSKVEATGAMPYQAPSPDLVKDVLEERAAGVQEPTPAAMTEAPSVVEQRGQLQQPPQTLQIIIEQIEIGTQGGHFTWRDLLAKMDVKLTVQLAAAYRETLIANSKCPVCGHKIPQPNPTDVDKRANELRDEVVDALARLENMDIA